jgi:CHRD domain
MTRLRIVLVVVVAALTAVGIAVAVPGGNFSVHATGDLEVPVARDTGAQGQATFKLSADGESLSYKLNVANIENVIMAHIHTTALVDPGPIVVWLYPSTTPGPADPGGGRISGRIASGTITADDLVGPLAGADLTDLLELLQSGEAYVNVHTDDGVGDPNTGPGDFPGGEIRGNF